MPLLALLPFAALAQDAASGFDAHGFTLVAHDADPRDGLVLERPGAMRAGHVFGGGVVEYANAPLVLVDPSTGERDPVVDHLVALNTSFGAVVHERLRLDLGLPVFVAPDPVEGGPGGRGLAMGDLRIASMLALVVDHTGFGLGLVPWVELPTGSAKRYVGDRALGGGVLLTASQSWARAGLTANVGLAAEPEVDARNLRNADRGIIGLGGHILLGQTRSPDDAGAQTGISLEVRGELPWEAAAIAGTGAPWEAVASARHARSNGGFFTVGAATALTGGAGAAAFRVVLGGGFGAPLGPATQVAEILPPPPAPPPLAVRVLRDGAPVEGARIEAGGFTSTSQLTPVMIELPGRGRVEAAYGPCLAGVSDVDSSARTADVALLPVRPATLAVEVRDPSGATVPGASVELYADDSGCSPTPVWLDESASAMARVGATTWHVRASAPGHQPYAGDVIARADQVSVVNAVLVPNAPLGKVRVVERGIELLEQVHFDTGKATLRPGSELVLADVVRALAATEARGHVEVQGHTDDVGNDASNLALSQARAEAVVAWLVANGVAPARLTARGYGETRPLGPNDAAEGRQRNRRVEFVFQVAP